MRISRNSAIGGDWSLVGMAGLAAAAQRTGVDLDDDLDRATVEKLAAELSLTTGWFPLHDTPPVECLRRLHFGLAATLCGHGKQRTWAEDRGLLSIRHVKIASDLFKVREKRRVNLTRAILPNWQDDHRAKFPVEQVVPLYFGPLASLALPLPTNEQSVLVAPLTLDTRDSLSWCRAILPSDTLEFWPASPGDAILTLLVRLQDNAQFYRCLGAVAWVYGWSNANKYNREIVSIVRCDRVPDLDGWRRFAERTKPLHFDDTGRTIVDSVRGFVADNLLAGRRPYQGFTEFSRGKELRHLGRGSRALFATLL